MLSRQKTVEFTERSHSATQVCRLADVGVGCSECTTGASVTDGYRDVFDSDTLSPIRVPAGGRIFLFHSIICDWWAVGWEQDDTVKLHSMNE